MIYIRDESQVVSINDFKRLSLMNLKSCKSQILFISSSDLLLLYWFDLKIFHFLWIFHKFFHIFSHCLVLFSCSSRNSNRLLRHSLNFIVLASFIDVVLSKKKLIWIPSLFNLFSELLDFLNDILALSLWYLFVLDFSS